MFSEATRKSIRQKLDGADAEAGWKELCRLACDSSLPAAEFERLGALIAKRSQRLREVAAQSERVALLGQCTTNWLANALTLAGAADGVLVEHFNGEYDNIVAELASPTLAAFQPGSIVFVPWHRALLRHGPAPAAQRVEQEVELWERTWRQAQRLNCRIVQVGYDWVHPGPAGFHLDGLPEGHVGRIRRLNDALRQRLPAGAYFVDLPLVSGELGRRSMYEARGYHWTKNPLSPSGAVWLARHLWAGIRALRTGPKKVAVLDLDNTLWGGVVGELGALEVALGESADGESFRAFQTHLLGLAERGVLLSVASKNNPEDAREPFEKNPNMVLRSEHLSAFEATWEPKSLSLARIAEKLRLGLDSFVFLDDSPVEREQVRAALPEVAVPDLPIEPADLAFGLSSSLFFEAGAITDADRERGEQYRVEQLRDATQRSFETFDDYLRSLELRGKVAVLDEPQMLRAAQLVAKTNQFNLTSRRHDRETLEKMRANPKALCLSLHLGDRFGDYGMIGVLLAVPGSDGCLDIDTWLLSCRALSRTAEHFLFAGLVTRARAAGVARLTGTYLPTKKNMMVAELLPSFGFSELASGEDGARHFELLLDQAQAPTTFVSAE